MFVRQFNDFCELLSRIFRNARQRNVFLVFWEQCPGRGPLVLDGILETRKSVIERDVARCLGFQEHQARLRESTISLRTSARRPFGGDSGTRAGARRICFRVPRYAVPVLNEFGEFLHRRYTIQKLRR